MSTYQQITRIRTRKLGLLIYDVRISKGKGIEACAKAMGISPEEYVTIESGQKAPSLPQLESLAFYLDVPLEHFWSSQSLAEQKESDPTAQAQQLILLRQRIIGARLRMARMQLNLSLTEVSKKTSIPEENLKKYELGELAVPIPDLEILAGALEIRIEDLFDQKGPIGEWRARQEAIQKFVELPDDLKNFVCKPVNRPYLTLAMRLSDLSAEKLRIVAESLLEITY